MCYCTFWNYSLFSVKKKYFLGKGNLKVCCLQGLALSFSDDSLFLAYKVNEQIAST